MLGIHAGQSDQFLEQRRKRRRRRLPDLSLAYIDRYWNSRRLAWSGGSQYKPFVLFFPFNPIDFEPDQLPLDAVLRIFRESGLTDEILLVQMHHLAEAQLKWRI